MPIRLSFMIASALSRLRPPPSPSAVSESPSLVQCARQHDLQGESDQGDRDCLDAGCRERSDQRGRGQGDCHAGQGKAAIVRRRLPS